jgi:hypothetical protein
VAASAGALLAMVAAAMTTGATQEAFERALDRLFDRLWHRCTLVAARARADTIVAVGCQHVGRREASGWRRSQEAAPLGHDRWTDPTGASARTARARCAGRTCEKEDVAAADSRATRGAVAAGDSARSAADRAAASATIVVEIGRAATIGRAARSAAADTTWCAVDIARGTSIGAAWCAVDIARGTSIGAAWRAVDTARGTSIGAAWRAVDIARGTSVGAAWRAVDIARAAWRATDIARTAWRATIDLARRAGRTTPFHLARAARRADDLSIGTAEWLSVSTARGADCRATVGTNRAVRCRDGSTRRAWIFVGRDRGAARADGAVV